MAQRSLSTGLRIGVEEITVDEVIGECERVALRAQLVHLLNAALDLLPFLEPGLIQTEIQDDNLDRWIRKTIADNRDTLQDIATAMQLTDRTEEDGTPSDMGLPIVSEKTPTIQHYMDMYECFNDVRKQFAAMLEHAVGERRGTGITGRTQVLNATQNSIVALLQATQLASEETLEGSRQEILETAIRALRADKNLISEVARRRLEAQPSAERPVTLMRLRAITGTRHKVVRIDPGAVDAVIKPAQREELLQYCRALIEALLITYPFLRQAFQRSNDYMEATVIDLLKTRENQACIERKRTAKEESTRHGERSEDADRIEEAQQAFEARIAAILAPHFAPDAPNKLRDLFKQIQGIPDILELSILYKDQERILETIARDLAVKMKLFQRYFPDIQ